MKVNLDLSGIEDLMQRISTNQKVRVGVLGNKNQRDEGEAGNAEIGLKHEFGSNTENIPPRSFIRMPLEERKADIIRDMGIISGNLMENKITQTQALKQVGVSAENVIQSAFKTSGFGKWAKNSAETIRQKGSSKPLIDTAQLRRSITSDIK